jgi:hypothetical protein
MALWQISFFILPKAVLNNKVNFKINEECFDDAVFWIQERISPELFKPINKFLPQTKSWRDTLMMFGDENSNRLEVSFNEINIVEAVSFRIDFTSDYEKILRKLIDFFILNGLIILDNKLNILPLNFETLKEMIENSKQVNIYDILSGKNKSEDIDKYL